jgi:cytidylate kinase
METTDDVEVVRVAMGALIRRMTDDQINRVIGELEFVAEERGDRSGESPHAQAAQHLIAALESRRERRNGQNGHSVPPPSLAGAAVNGHDA